MSGLTCSIETISRRMCLLTSTCGMQGAEGKRTEAEEAHSNRHAGVRDEVFYSEVCLSVSLLDVHTLATWGVCADHRVFVRIHLSGLLLWASLRPAWELSLRIRQIHVGFCFWYLLSRKRFFPSQMNSYSSPFLLWQHGVLSHSCTQYTWSLCLYLGIMKIGIEDRRSFFLWLFSPFICGVYPHQIYPPWW